MSVYSTRFDAAGLPERGNHHGPVVAKFSRMTARTSATGCIRLYDLDLHAIVGGTQRCVSGASMTNASSTYVTSTAINVSPGLHHYVTQSSFNFPSDGVGFLSAIGVELVVDW